MPHDKKGKVVEVGQIVRIDCKVLGVSQNEEACNATLETVDPMFPYDHKTQLTANTKQLEVVREADWRG